jgi:NAD(P)-dependent dehydrogenase (short-subunit alcohol dehydrogenase family)
MTLPWSHAIVVGASSGIGAELARQLAGGGCRVALVARREDELRRLAEALDGVSPAPTRVYPHDVTAYDDAPACFERIRRELGGLDLVVYAAGVMPRIGAADYAFATDRRIVETNLLGAVAWLNEAARHFAGAGRGTIIGISSVAGDRGRRDNPVYCASKAGLTAYLEALRNRVGRAGVVVVTAKPGPVDTPMTRGLDRLPLLISAPEAARRILAAARRRRTTVYVPEVWRLIMLLVQSLPSPLFRRLDL